MNESGRLPGIYGVLLLFLAVALPLPFAVWLIDLRPWLDMLEPIDAAAVGYRGIETFVLSALSLSVTRRIWTGPPAVCWASAVGAATVVDALVYLIQLRRSDAAITLRLLTGHMSSVGVLIGLQVLVSGLAAVLGMMLVAASLKSAGEGRRRPATAGGAALVIAALVQIGEHLILSRAFYEEPAAPGGPF